MCGVTLSSSPPEGKANENGTISPFSSSLPDICRAISLIFSSQAMEIPEAFNHLLYVSNTANELHA